MAKPPASFTTGDEVEVICQDEGFKGSLYQARIVRCLHKLGRYSVEYETLMSDADPGKNLRETVSAAHVRPRPPPCAGSSFEIGEKVDAFHNDGWWVGEVEKVLEGGKKFAVRFPDCDEPDDKKEVLEFGLDGIRVHMDWIDGCWIMPKISVQDEFSITQNLCGIEPDAFRKLWNAISIAHESRIPILNGGSDENPCKSHDSAANLDSMNLEEATLQVQIESSRPFQDMAVSQNNLKRKKWPRRENTQVRKSLLWILAFRLRHTAKWMNLSCMEFREGDVVEVSSDDEGFCGAWYTATIIGSNREAFLVEYQNLRTDDDTEVLKETVDSSQIRPIPPNTPVVDNFKLLEEVDAFHNDGWWVGVISKVLEGPKYMVYFKPWNEEIEFGHNDLRLHHEWIDGKWLQASKALDL